MAKNAVAKAWVLVLGEENRRYSDAPFDLTPPTAPGIIATGSSTATSITVQVTTPSTDSRHPVFAYVFEFRTLAENSANLPWTVRTPVGSVQATSGFDLTGLQPGTTYFIRCKGLDSSVAQNESAYSTSISAATAGSAGDSWYPNWPMMLHQSCHGSSSQNILDPSTYSVIADHDVYTYQSYYPTTTRLTNRVNAIAAIRAVQAAPMYTRFLEYHGEQQIDKTALDGNLSVPLEFLDDANEGNADWYLRRASNNAKIEATFNPASLWFTNMARNSLVNSHGQTWQQKYWNYWKSKSVGAGTPSNVVAVTDGVFVDDVHCRPQTPMTVSNGTVTVTDADMNGDDVADGITDFSASGGAMLWCLGRLDSKTAFEAEYTAQSDGSGRVQAWYPNSGRFSTNYTDGGGAPPLPISNHPFYHKLDFSFRESIALAFGITKTSTTYNYNGVSMSTACRDIAIHHAMLRPDSQNTVSGKGCVILYTPIINRTPVADDFEFARLIGALALLHERAGPSISRGGVIPWSPDEFLLELGNPLAPRNMGTLNENTAGFTMRAPNVTIGAAQFYWAEFEKGIVVARLDSPAVGVWPNGTAVTVTLPNPGAGKTWQMPNAASYTNPITGRSMRNQQASVNNGATVTTLSLKPYHARFVRRV